MVLKGVDGSRTNTRHNIKVGTRTGTGNSEGGKLNHLGAKAERTRRRTRPDTDKPSRTNVRPKVQIGHEGDQKSWKPQNERTGGLGRTNRPLEQIRDTKLKLGRKRDHKFWKSQTEAPRAKSERTHRRTEAGLTNRIRSGWHTGHGVKSTPVYGTCTKFNSSPNHVPLRVTLIAQKRKSRLSRKCRRLWWLKYQSTGPCSRSVCICGSRKPHVRGRLLTRKPPAQGNT